MKHTSIRVVTANIAECAFAPPSTIAEALKSAQVVLLQEVKRGPHVDQFQSIADELKKCGWQTVHMVFRNTYWYEGGDFGIGILSRYPLNNDLPQYSLKEESRVPNEIKLQDRVVIQSSIESLGNEVRLFNTHLPHNACICTNAGPGQNCDPGNRQYMLEWIAWQVHPKEKAKYTGRAICGGDLNTTRASTEMRFLRSQLVDCWETFAGHRYDYEELTRTVDYIFSRGFEVEDYQRVDEGLSDHPFVFVTFRT